jgi:hypothetical protein
MHSSWQSSIASIDDDRSDWGHLQLRRICRCARLEQGAAPAASTGRAAFCGRSVGCAAPAPLMCCCSASKWCTRLHRYQLARWLELAIAARKEEVGAETPLDRAAAGHRARNSRLARARPAVEPVIARAGFRRRCHSTHREPRPRYRRGPARACWAGTARRLCGCSGQTLSEP